MTRFFRSHPVTCAAKAKLTFGVAIFLVVSGMFITRGSVMRPPPKTAQMQLTSSAFQEGRAIPSQYTCDGKNISPPLAWSGAPSTTESFVVMMDDPDSPSGVWTHWVMYNLPVEAQELVEGAAKGQSLPGNAEQGMNSFKAIGYGGPCPPSGKPHRYFFKIFALDTTLDVKSGAVRSDVEAAMGGHIVAQGQLMGTYLRK